MDVDVSPSNGFSQIYNSLNSSMASVNPLVLLTLTLIIIFYFLVFSYFGVGGQEQRANAWKPSGPGIKVVEMIMWGLLIFLVLINGLQYFFKINVTTAIKNLFSGNTEVEIDIKPPEKIKAYKEKKKENKERKKEENKVEKKLKQEVKDLEKEIEKDLGLANLKPRGKGSNLEVFNIADNTYTYEDAKGICKAYGADLATYDQIEDAYKSGAEWCNYGWSANQAAFFPTQKATWKRLQKIKGHEHDCGRQGINGGYIGNPNVRFGVNCYGRKPNITKREQKIMNNAGEYPESEENKQMNTLVQSYKKKLKTILISPFNLKSWNQL